jgi:serine/threonine-protein kinase HipA
MEQIIKVGTSAGGARAKAVIAWNEETKDIRSGQVEAGKGYGYWLIKFDGVKNNKDKGDKEDSPEYTRIEYAYHRMAIAAGIDMSECRLYEENGNYHFMTKRFDRDLGNGTKIHMQSLGAMAHYDFNEPGAYSYEQAATILYQLGMGQKEIEQLYRRMVFNIIARNQDDHVKNISFLMDKKGKWTLAPAYDITYSYDKTNRWLAQHQMSINGKVDNFTMADLREAASRMNIGKRRMEKIVEEVSIAVFDWKNYAENAGVRDRTYGEIKNNLYFI